MRPDALRTTRRFGWGLATSARPRFTYARLSETGVVHIVTGAIIRWDFMGGTWERPMVSYVMACGPQTERPLVVRTERVKAYRLCARCGSVDITRKGRQTGQ